MPIQVLRRNIYGWISLGAASIMKFRSNIEVLLIISFLCNIVEILRVSTISHVQPEITKSPLISASLFKLDFELFDLLHLQTFANHSHWVTITNQQKKPRRGPGEFIMRKKVTCSCRAASRIIQWITIGLWVLPQNGYCQTPVTK